MPSNDHVMRYINIVSRCATIWRTDKLEGTELGDQHYSYILVVCRRPGISQDAISRRLFINKSNVTRHLTQLEKNGYVERRQSEEDKRVMLVYPTEKAYEVLPRMIQAHDPYRVLIKSSPEIPAGFHMYNVPEQHKWGARAWYKDDFYRLGHFFMVINPEFFAGLDTFKSTTGDILRALRGSTKAPGAERIYTAGEKEHLAWVEREPLGVPVGEAIQKEFIQLRDECGLDYKFPFEK
mgnify:CR=1 FL=1